MLPWSIDPNSIIQKVAFWAPTDERTADGGKDFVNQDQGKNLPRTFAKFHAEQGCKIVVRSSEAIHAYSEMSLEVKEAQIVSVPNFGYFVSKKE